MESSCLCQRALKYCTVCVKTSYEWRVHVLMCMQRALKYCTVCVKTSYEWRVRVLMCISVSVLVQRVHTQVVCVCGSIWMYMCARVWCVCVCMRVCVRYAEYVHCNHAIAPFKYLCPVAIPVIASVASP